VDGSPVLALSPSLVRFTSRDATYFVRVGRYGVSSDFTAEVFNATLTISSCVYPLAKYQLNVVFRIDPQVIAVPFDDTLTSLSLSFNQPIAFDSNTNCARVFTSETVSKLCIGSCCIRVRRLISRFCPCLNTAALQPIFFP